MCMSKTLNCFLNRNVFTNVCPQLTSLIDDVVLRNFNGIKFEFLARSSIQLAPEISDVNFFHSSLYFRDYRCCSFLQRNSISGQYHTLHDVQLLENLIFHGKIRHLFLYKFAGASLVFQSIHWGHIFL